MPRFRTVREGQLARLEGPGTSLERLVFADGSTAAWQGLFCHAPTRQQRRRPGGRVAASRAGDGVARRDLAARLGCHLFDDDAVEVNVFGQTTRSGVYGVGDMARTASNPFVPHQIFMAVAQGSVAGVVIGQKLLYSD